MDTAENHSQPGKQPDKPADRAQHHDKHHDTAAAHYAVLHRTVEGGRANAQTWAQLVKVCIELHKQDEGLAAFGSLEDPGLRAGLRRRLIELGWLSSDEDPEEAKRLRVTESDLVPSIRELVEDALTYLFEGSMPRLCITFTVAFPLALGACGLFTAGVGSLVLQLLAVIPSLFVLGLCGAVGKRVLQLALQGLDESPDLPEFSVLAREGVRALGDLMALGAALLGPAVLFAALGAPMVAVPLALIGGGLMPMALALRLSCDDWRLCAPKTLLAMIRRTSPRYLAVAGITLLLFAPSGLAFFLTLGTPVFVAVLAIGPLAVAPSFVAARLLGQVLHYQRDLVADLVELPTDRRSRPAKPAAGKGPQGRQARAAAAPPPATPAAPAAPARPAHHPD